MAKAEKRAAPEAAPGDTGAAVEVLEFNGLKIPADGLFVSPGVTRHVEIGDGQVFLFQADVERQLPPYAIVPCISQGIQLVK